MTHFPRLTEELFTIRDWLRFTVSQFEEAEVFFGHGTDNSYDEAVWLVMSALHLPHDTLNNFLDAVITEQERKHLAHLIEQRITKRTPTAYLVREAWLRGFKFYVDERVIVPRSFIAELLDFNEEGEHGLQPWIEHPELINSAADICTGSGCLGILLANAFPDAAIDVVDISADAIAVANININNYGLTEQITAIQSDMFTALQGKTYDLIISNPPYVDGPSMAALPLEYQNEPQLALGSGADGLDHTHTILREAANYLNDDGLLIVEIGHNRDALLDAYPDMDFTWLTVESGNQYVFLLTKEQLLQIAS
ncbi:50S ribosomal protein L3 N(5)-glutamine methyltransferase [Methylotenera versatilis]|uniref:50S ribosomal protein L3 N(5)-glutamine methyltransferase n=1 Tax=Methylotenera versatilis TaxID=1055487 RepID=UPI000649161F|nr:50S ribosomal protein L3 N(5)-glutamine methyltransferase [Methylotenera versatilis]